MAGLEVSGTLAGLCIDAINHALPRPRHRRDAERKNCGRGCGSDLLPAARLSALLALWAYPCSLTRLQSSTVRGAHCRAVGGE